MQAYSLFGGSDSKCPVARLVNGGKPAEALIAEGGLSPEAQRFQSDEYNYAPFTAPSYQVRRRMLAVFCCHMKVANMSQEVDGEP